MEESSAAGKGCGPSPPCSHGGRRGWGRGRRGCIMASAALCSVVTRLPPGAPGGGGGGALGTSLRLERADLRGEICAGANVPATQMGTFLKPSLFQVDYWPPDSNVLADRGEVSGSLKLGHPQTQTGGLGAGSGGRAGAPRAPRVPGGAGRSAHAGSLASPGRRPASLWELAVWSRWQRARREPVTCKSH